MKRERNPTVQTNRTIKCLVLTEITGATSLMKWQYKLYLSLQKSINKSRTWTNQSTLINSTKQWSNIR